MKVDQSTARTRRFCHAEVANVPDHSSSIPVFDTFPDQDLDRFLGVVEGSPSATSKIHVYEEKVYQRWKKRRPSSQVNLKIPKPKRPLTAYNFYFRYERARLVGAAPPSESISSGKRIHRKTHGVIGFVDLAKTIGSKWNDLDASSRETFEQLALEDLKRYREEMSVYSKKLQASDQRLVDPKKEAKVRKTRRETKKADISHSRLKIYHDSSNGAESGTKHGAWLLRETLSKTLDICEDAKNAYDKSMPSSNIPRNSKVATASVSKTPYSSSYLHQLDINHEPSISHGSIGDLESDLSCLLGDEVIQFLSNISEDEPKSLALKDGYIWGSY